jgi:hypothetical protein
MAVSVAFFSAEALLFSLDRASLSSSRAAAQAKLPAKRLAGIRDEEMIPRIESLLGPGGVV